MSATTRSVHQPIARRVPSTYGWPGRRPAMVREGVPRITWRDRKAGKALPDHCHVNQAVESKRKLMAGRSHHTRQRHRPISANKLFLFDFHKKPPISRGAVRRLAAHHNCARLSLRQNFFCAKLPIARGKREPGGHQNSSLNTGDGCATALAVAAVVLSFSHQVRFVQSSVSRFKSIKEGISNA